MRLALILFILGIMMITAGFVNQVAPKCKEGVEIRIVPRSVYDEIVSNSTLGY
jgi:hypothetical protein|tara:strand:+ start:204 stop:362 length:159 start_codon:yes stop_codon:yes gene_type:complete